MSKCKSLTAEYKSKSKSLAPKSKSKSESLTTESKSKSAKNRTQVRLESKSRTRVLQLCLMQLKGLLAPSVGLLWHLRDH